MSSGKKNPVNWGMISYVHKLELLSEAGINVHRLTQEDVNNYGAFMLENVEKQRENETIPRPRIRATRASARRGLSSRRRLPPRRRSR